MNMNNIILYTEPCVYKINIINKIVLYYVYILYSKEKPVRPVLISPFCVIRYILY